MERKKLSGARLVVLCGLMAALLTVCKLAMSPMPNIEPVSLLIMVYAMVFGRQVFFAIVPFVAVEGLLYGFNPFWWVSYCYVWPLWGWLCTRLPRERPLVSAVAAGAFGLSFGALFALPYLVAGGPWAALSWWVAGIPADLLHCAGNFCLAWFLSVPLYRLLSRLRDDLI